MILLQLWWSFTKIGITSFGGVSMVPLVSSEMIDHGWMNAMEVADIVAIAEMTPGPLGLNCATFAGMRTAGVAGAIMANLGVLMPTLTLCVLAAMFYTRFRENKLVRKALLGIRPACVGLIAGVIVEMTLGNYLAPMGGISWGSVAIGAVCLVLLLRYHWSVPKTIGLAALLGLVLFGLPIGA